MSPDEARTLIQQWQAQLVDLQAQVAALEAQIKALSDWLDWRNRQA